MRLLEPDFEICDPNKNWGAHCAAWSTHQLAFSCAFLSSTNLFQIHKTQAFLRLRLSAEEVALTKHGQHVSFCWTIIVMTKNKVFLILVENRGNQKIHYFPYKVELHMFSWHGCLPKGPWSIVKNHKRLHKNNTDKSLPLSHIKHVYIMQMIWKKPYST